MVGYSRQVYKYYRSSTGLKKTARQGAFGDPGSLELVGAGIEHLNCQRQVEHPSLPVM